MDRIDIHADVPRVDYDKLTDDRLGEPSARIRERVERARAVQRERFADTPLSTNADMGPAEVRVYCSLDDTSKGLLKAAVPNPGALRQDLAKPKAPKGGFGP